METDVRQLVTDMEELRTDIREQLRRTDNIAVVTEIGHRLLEANELLSSQLESTTKHFMNAIEMLKQEKHSFSLKLEQKIWAEKTCLEEIESLKQFYKDEKQKADKSAAQEKQATQIKELKAQIEVLEQNLSQCEIEKQSLSEQNIDIMNQLQRKLTEDKMEKREKDEELAFLTDQVEKLCSEKMRLSEVARESEMECKQLLQQVTSLRHTVADNKEQLEEYELQVADYSRSLDVERETNLALREELTALKVGAPDAERKGNSLFAEVEDRRIEAEKKLISLEVVCEGQKQQLENMRLQLRSLKGQIAGLLLSAGGRSTEEHVARLELQLADALNDRQVLTCRLREYERNNKQTITDGNSADYWKALLDAKERELGEMREELRTKRLLLLKEKDCNIQYEREMYAKTMEISQLKGNIVKLQLRLDEMIFKYEPEKANKKAARHADKVRQHRRGENDRDSSESDGKTKLLSSNIGQQSSSVVTGNEHAKRAHANSDNNTDTSIVNKENEHSDTNDVQHNINAIPTKPATDKHQSANANDPDRLPECKVQ